MRATWVVLALFVCTGALCLFLAGYGRWIEKLHSVPGWRAVPVYVNFSVTFLLNPDWRLPDGVDMEKYVADIERSLLLSALSQCNGVQTRAADLLKISYRSFRHLMKKYDL